MSICYMLGPMLFLGIYTIGTQSDYRNTQTIVKLATIGKGQERSRWDLGLRGKLRKDFLEELMIYKISVT